MEEPNCQTVRRIRTQMAVPRLPIQEVVTWKPRACRTELMTPLEENSCFHMTATATLPPIMEGR